MRNTPAHVLARLAAPLAMGPLLAAATDGACGEVVALSRPAKDAGSAARHAFRDGWRGQDGESTTGRP